MNSIWNKNLELFKARFPQLHKMCLPQIEQAQKILEGLNPNFIGDKGGTALIDNCQIELLRARNGEISGKERGAALHSLYNPSREALNAVSQAEVASKGTGVFLGTGLGWQIIEFAKKYGEKKLVVIEPDVLHLFAAMCVLDWEAVFKHESLILAIGCPLESVLGLLEDTSKVNVGNTGVSDAFVFDIPAFTAHAAAYFNNVRSIIKRNQRKNEINAATLKKFGKLWVRNSMKNLLQMSRCEGIAGFENKAPLPFLILGAGPSLESIIPHLAELKKRMVVVCVETALATLLRHNFEPDFIMLFDPQFWAYRHIAGLHSPSSVLITEVSAYPAVFRFQCKKIMLCKSQFPVGQYFEEKLRLSLGDLGTGGSVASAAWNFAHFCGAKTVFTAGLDLSFPKNQTHIRGSSAEQTFHTIARRTCPVEKLTTGVLFGANASPAKNYLGESVTTDSRMKMFAWWFESRLVACPETKTYTLCPQAMKVPGIELAKIMSALELPEIQVEKEAFLSKNGTQPAAEEALTKIAKDFPSEDFLTQNEFLRECFSR